MDKTLQDLIFKAIDQTIEVDEFTVLQEAIEHDDEVRDEYLKAVRLTMSLQEIAAEPADGQAHLATPFGENQSSLAFSVRRSSVLRRGVMLASLLLVFTVAYLMGRGDRIVPKEETIADINDAESVLIGHATLKRAVDVRWADDTRRFREGDLLPNGILKFDDGIAEIDFFCGATLIVEGPAELDIESDWIVSLRKGRLRANVPPAARGFIVRAAGSDIVDLGTEFAVAAEDQNARVEVLDGEIKIQGGQHDGSHLYTGDRRWMIGTEVATAVEGISTLVDLQDRRTDAVQQRFNEWKAGSEVLDQDERLLAYYPIARMPVGRFVSNQAIGPLASDGKLIGPVEVQAGRFNEYSPGLNFSRPGARVRTRIDGQFGAVSFACWVKIDRLEHLYNALFMSDGYENGEVHWQIRSDGRMMISVMVDDTQPTEHFNRLEQQVVTTAGLARVYHSEPIWDAARSGQWIHLAAVYDPVSRRVTQYADGQKVCDEQIVDRYYVDTIRIGAAEIGNWGQPFRDSPTFAVRNLNGTIDELAVFGAALSSQDVQELYEKGRPVGY